MGRHELREVLVDVFLMAVFLLVVLGMGVMIGMVATFNKVGKGEWHIVASTNVQAEVKYKLDFK